MQFGIALDNQRLLKPATITQMWTPQKLTDGNPTKYGLGFQIKNVQGKKRVAHGGGQAGTSTHLLILPENDVVVAAMSNLQHVRMEQVTSLIAAQLPGIQRPKFAWSEIIPKAALQTEVQRLQMQIARRVATRAAFDKAPRSELRRDATTLAVMMAIMGQYDQQLRLQPQASALRDRFARLAKNAKVSNTAVFNSARQESQLLTQVLRGQRPKELDGKQQAEIKNWSKIADRSPLMKRMEVALKMISVG